MITPVFKVTQTSDLIIIEITAKYSKENVCKSLKCPLSRPSNRPDLPDMRTLDYSQMAN